MKNKDEFIEICQRYVGTFEENENCITFRNKNKMFKRYVGGELLYPKMIEAAITLDCDSNHLEAEEETYEYEGGICGCIYNKSLLEHLLDRYFFEKKNYIQMTIFEML